MYLFVAVEVEFRVYRCLGMNVLSWDWGIFWKFFGNKKPKCGAHALIGASLLSN